MISLRHDFIYVHVPKTGGTTIQNVLLPFAEDEKFLAPHQDGIDSFEVRGPLTSDKHDSLQDYSNRLGCNLDRFRIVVSVRHPVRRIISAIYSPHKWVYQNRWGKWKKKTPYWDRGLLEDILTRPNLRPTVEFLRVDGVIREPDIVIRCENLEKELGECMNALGLPCPAKFPRANQSAASPGMLRNLLSDASICGYIEEIYAEDMRFFRYPSMVGG